MRPALVFAALLFALPALADEAAPAADPAAAPPGDPSLQEELDRALATDLAARAAQKPADAAKEPAPAARSFQSLNPDLSLIGDFALAAFSEAAPRQLGGHDPTGNGFNLQAVELTLSAAVDPYLRMDANLAFNPRGEFELEEAYATSLALPFNLQLRAGQMLARFGRLNPTHPHAWDFSDQPLVLGKLLGGDGLRGRAGEVSVLLPLPWYVEAVVAAQNAQDARSFYDGVPRLTRTALDLVYLGALKQFFALGDDLSLAWGLSALAGPNAAATHGRTEIYGTDLYLKFRPLTEGSTTIVSLTMELLGRRRHGYDAAGNAAGATLVDGGGYAQLFWRFSGRWGAGLRGDYVTGATDDPLDPAWNKPRWRASAAMTFWPTEFSRLRLQVNEDRALFEDRAVQSVYLAFEFAAGAHGAHAF